MKKVIDHLLLFFQKFKHCIITFIFFVVISLINQYYSSQFNIKEYLNLKMLFFSFFWVSLILIYVIYSNPKYSRFVILILEIILAIITVANYFFINYFGTFFSWKDLFLSSEGVAYVDSIFPLINFKIIMIFFILIALITINFVNFPTEKIHFGKIVKIIIICFISIIVFIYGMIIYNNRSNNKVFNSWNSIETFKNDAFFYNEWTNVNLLVKKYGIYEYLFHDLYVLLFKKDNVIDSYNYVKEKLENYNTTNKTNDYTGIFDNKNLIFVMMEGFDDWLITEKSTPTIYSMMKNGISFNNHYSLVYVTGKTSQSEFIANTGIYQNINSLSAHYAYVNNSYPFSLANLFKSKGYAVNSFHVNNGSIYNRGAMMKSLGYDNYYNLLHMKISSEEKVFDKNLALKGYDLMVSKKPFMNFIITLSGHTPYSYTKKECQSNLDEIKKIFPNETREQYLCGYTQASETDLMFKVLLEKLENDDLLNDTVIIAFADHPNNVHLFKDETLNLNKTVMFIYNPEIKPLVVNNITNTINILPMINNLFELNSDYYMAGYDPLSFDESYLIMPDFTLYQDSKYETLTKYYLDKILMSKNILISNYYK